MSTRNLDKIFRPRGIAVIGACNVPGGAGETVLRNLVAAEYGGAVYKVCPQGAYQDVRGLPETPDLAVVCTPAEEVPAIVRACGEKGIAGVVVLSAGFRELGDSGRRLEEDVRCEQRKFDGMRILGPNCLGVIVPGAKLNASLAATMPKPGNIGFISQSGALCASVLDWAIDEGVGFSHFVSVGNMLDVSLGDLIDYLGAATETRSLILYVESIGEAREFLSAARAFARSKPIVAYKAGRFPESARAAASHTGAMAGVDAVYEAAFQRAGIERILEIDDMFDCAELLPSQVLPQSDRLAIVTNAGGPGVMTTDVLIARGGRLASLTTETMAALDSMLPQWWSHGNPVDIHGDATPDRFARALDVVLRDAGVDAALVILTPQANTEPAAVARGVAAVASYARKPILAAWMGGRTVREGIEVLRARGVPTYKTPAKAVQAFMHLVSYARNRALLHETPHDLSLEFGLDRKQLRERLRSFLPRAARCCRKPLPRPCWRRMESPRRGPIRRPRRTRRSSARGGWAIRSC